MKIQLTSDTSLTAEDSGGPLTVEADNEQRIYSPFHMLASGLAVCTFSVLQSWASHASLETSGLRVEINWVFAESPHRIGELKVAIHWPGLPPARQAAAKRAAELCPIHHTFVHPPTIGIEVV